MSDWQLKQTRQYGVTKRELVNNDFLGEVIALASQPAGSDCEYTATDYLRYRQQYVNATDHEHSLLLLACMLSKIAHINQFRSRGVMY